MFCTACGRKLAEGAVFCPYCGHPVASAVRQDGVPGSGAKGGRPMSCGPRRPSPVLLGAVSALVVATAAFGMVFAFRLVSAPAPGQVASAASATTEASSVTTAPATTQAPESQPVSSQATSAPSGGSTAAPGTPAAEGAAPAGQTAESSAAGRTYTCKDFSITVPASWGEQGEGWACDVYVTETRDAVRGNDGRPVANLTYVFATGNGVGAQSFVVVVNFVDIPEAPAGARLPGGGAARTGDFYIQAQTDVDDFDAVCASCEAHPTPTGVPEGSIRG